VISPGLYARISTYAGLSAIGTRWYPGVLPQDATLPAGVYYCVSRTRTPSQSGGGPYNTRWQLDIYSDDYDQCEALANALDACMHGYKGTITVGGTDYEIGASFLDNGRGPNHEPSAAGVGPEGGRYRASSDYKITHQEVT